MKKIYILIFVISLFSVKVNAQLPTYQWSDGMGSPSSDNGFAVATDAIGNSYVTGYFSGTTDFDPSAGVSNLTSNGGVDAFLAKYDPSGVLIWAFNIGSAGNFDVGESVAVDAAGNILITGQFNGTADFDPSIGVFNVSTLSANPGLFVAKYDSNAILQWAFQLSDADSGTGENGTGITTDALNNVIITGYFMENNIDFNPGAGIFTLPNPTFSKDIFLAKYSPAGAFVWAFSIGSTSAILDDAGNSVSCDASSNIYLTGYSKATCDFDPGAGNVSPAQIGTQDAFIAKYSSAGAYLFAFRIGNGAQTCAGNSIKADAGGCAVTGYFGGTPDFNPGVGVANLTSAGGTDIFVAKYDNTAIYQWAFRVGSAANGEYGTSITKDPSSGNIYFTGQYAGTSDFDPGASTANLTPVGGTDGFVSGYTNSGNYLWAFNIGSLGGDEGMGIALDGSSNILTTGWFSSTVDFDPSASVANITTAGVTDIYLAKYAPPCVIPSTPGAITGTTTICSGSSNTYSITAVAGATSYTWTLPGGWTGVSTTNSITTTASATSGNITVTANNTCGNSAAATLAITVNTIPVTPGAITGTTPICSGSSNTYSITAVAGATSYTWTKPGGWTGVSTTNSITTTASATSGNITVIATNACGTSSAATLAITVNTIPVTPGAITGSTTVCSGSSNIYSITAVAGATSYTWTLPGGWTGVSTTNSITTTASATSGNITVTATNSCGTSSAQTLAITVNSIPATPGAITGSTTVCQTSSNTYSVTAVAGATSYTWTLPGGWTGVSTTNSITTTAGASSGNITVTANNACGNSSIQTLAITVNTIPSTPGAITGTTTICSGTSNTYSITAVAGATSYTWTLPGGWAGVSTTNSINATSSATSGNITVTANNACGNSPAQTLAITVNSTPATPGVISGTTTICNGSTNTYNITAVAGATSYTWTLPGGWTGASTTNSISATASGTSGNITVTATNTCGTSSAQTLAITVNSTPATPGTITGPSAVCVGTSNTYSVTSVAGATSYTWILPSGWSSSSTTNSITTTASATSGNVMVIANNTCGSSAAQTLAVTVNPLPTVTYSQSPSTVCVNATSVALTGNSPAGGIFSGTSVTGSTFNASTAGLGTFPIVYSFTDVNSCTNTATSNIIVSACTGIQQLTNNNQEPIIYPNPTSSVVNVIASGAKQSQISVLNILGETVYSTISNSEKTEIDLSKETNGIYFIKIVTERGTVTKRIVKQ